MAYPVAMALNLTSSTPSVRADYIIQTVNACRLHYRCFDFSVVAHAADDPVSESVKSLSLRSRILPLNQSH